MIKIMTKYEFIKEWPQQYQHNFSREGLEALFDNSEDDTEFDPSSFCLTFKEWESIEEFNSNCGGDFQDIAEIEEITDVIYLSGGSFLTKAY